MDEIWSTLLNEYIVGAGPGRFWARSSKWRHLESQVRRWKLSEQNF